MSKTIGRNLLLAFCFALVVLIANAAVSYRATGTLIESNRWVSHTYEVIGELNAVLAGMKDAETGQRGFLVTGEERFLEPYQTAESRVRENLECLKKLTADSQFQQSRIPELEKIIAERFEFLKAGIAIRRANGFDERRLAGLMDEGRTKMDDIRQLVAEMIGEERRLLDLRIAETRSSGRNTILTFVIANLLVVGLLGLVYFLINRDVNEQTRVERVLQEAHDKLEIRVEERTKELAQSNTELERSNRELQDFAFVASHDLQEPLRKIQTFGDRLKTKHGDALGEQGIDYLGRMQNAASRMQILINDLLTFSRVTSKAQPFAAVDLSRVAQEVLGDLEARIQQTAGDIEIGNLPTIEADPLQMRQLLQNLLGNALKFHRPNAPPLVKISGHCADENQNGLPKNHCELKIEDNGIGFDIKYLDRIFTPFQRLHTRNQYEGTGMGLAVCRKIIERHGGTITADSQPGEGTTFIVTLPIKQNQGES